jgi:membrane-associated protease RseP (regulator of RpoE activity)
VDDEGEAPPAPAQEDVIIHLDAPQGDGAAEVRKFITLSDSAPAPGKYWIGVMCNPVDESLRSQLNLAEGEGVIVVDVVPDSPAAKVGLKKFDVVTQAGETKLSDAGQLAKAVEENGTKELTLTVIRAGKPETVTITPAEREAVAPAENKEVETRAFQLLRRLREDGGNGPVIRMFHPGFVYEPQEMPENLNITVEKHGNTPAKIHVEQDGKTWDVTEENIDELPDELRGHVARLVGQGGSPIDILRSRREGEQNFDIKIVPPPPGPGPAGRVRALPPGVGPEGPQRVRARIERGEGGPTGERLERRMDELNARLDRLQRLIERMNEARGEKEAPPQP